MNLPCFKFLLSHIAFDGPNTRHERWTSDRFAARRELFEMFQRNLSKFFTPSEYLSIDETLYPMRHQIAFRQYNPNKPAKYGLLHKSLNGARFPYTYKAVPYAGKPSDGTGPYNIDSTQGYVKYLVNETSKHKNTKGRSISTDRLNISILQPSRIRISAELKECKTRQVYSATYHFEKEDKDLCAR